jgi:hypothetical protein
MSPAGMSNDKVLQFFVPMYLQAITLSQAYLKRYYAGSPNDVSLNDPIFGLDP